MPNKFTPNPKKGNLLGTCTINYHGLILKHLRVMRGNEQIWIAFPSTPRKDKQGNQAMNDEGKPIYDKVIYPSSRGSLENIEHLVDNAVCEYIGAPVIEWKENEVQEPDEAWFYPFKQGRLLGFANIRYKGVCVKGIRLFKEENGIKLAFPIAFGANVCMPENQTVAKEIFELIKKKM